jgi:hypothetical protein
VQRGDTEPDERVGQLAPVDESEAAREHDRGERQRRARAPRRHPRGAEGRRAAHDAREQEHHPGEPGIEERLLDERGGDRQRARRDERGEAPAPQRRDQAQDRRGCGDGGQQLGRRVDRLQRDR